MERTSAEGLGTVSPVVVRLHAPQLVVTFFRTVLVFLAFVLEWKLALFTIFCVSCIQETHNQSGYQNHQHIYKTRDKNVQQEFHETCHSVTFYFMKKDSQRC